jgi:hypothetical protein
MTKIIIEALLITGGGFAVLFILSLISSKIKGKKDLKSNERNLLEKKTNIREIYIQNINRSLGKPEPKRENKSQKSQTTDRKNQKIRLVKENYNQTMRNQFVSAGSSYEKQGMFYTARNFQNISTTNQFYYSSNKEL